MNTTDDNVTVLYFDEWPANLHQADRQFGAVVSLKGKGYNATRLTDKELTGLIEKRNILCSAIFIRKTTLTEHYFNEIQTNNEGEFTGSNMLWSGLLAYTMASFLKANEVYSDIQFIYDPKSLSYQHRVKIHNFIKEVIPDIHRKKFNRTINVQIEEGTKHDFGIKIVDQVVRLASRDKLPSEDYTQHFERNVIENPGSFGLAE